LKQTKFYQEVFAEGEAEKQKAVILRMFKMELPPAQIAIFLDLPIAEVEATIAQAAQEQN
jgi:predicted transposase YdaD